MTPAKVDVCFAFFPYGGVGSSSLEVPTVRRWFTRSMVTLKTDPYFLERVDKIYDFDKSDTPITMTRNRAVRDAIEMGCDFLIMCDSDMAPDLYAEDGAPTFLKTAFEFAYNERLEGRHALVAAPYCGPPPIENVYIFRWGNSQSEHPNADHSIEQFSREEAAQRAGIERVAALPTGLMLIDLQIPNNMPTPWFYYEYDDHYQSEKSSTEDVTFTRDAGLTFQEKFGYSPVCVAWDCWAGHWKPKCVGKPRPITIEQINQNYREAVLANRVGAEKLTFVRSGKNLRHEIRNTISADFGSNGHH